MPTALVPGPNIMQNRTVAVSITTVLILPSYKEVMVRLSWPELGSLVKYENSITRQYGYRYTHLDSTWLMPPKFTKTLVPQSQATPTTNAEKRSDYVSP